MVGSGLVKEFLVPPCARRNKKLPECASDHMQIGSCSSPAPPGQMANPNFPERAASGVEPVEQLGVDHRSACFKRMALEKIGAQELERAVNIAHAHAQGQPDNELPAPGIELAHPGILALHPIPNHRIERIDQGEEALQLAYIKLAIRIHKDRQLFRGSGKTIGQCRAIALITCVRAYTDAPVQLL